MDCLTSFPPLKSLIYVHGYIWPSFFYIAVNGGFRYYTIANMLVHRYIFPYPLLKICVPHHTSLFITYLFTADINTKYITMQWIFGDILSRYYNTTSTLSVSVATAQTNSHTTATHGQGHQPRTRSRVMFQNVSCGVS